MCGEKQLRVNYMNCADAFIGFDFFSLLNDRQQSNFILGEDNETRSHLDLSQFAQCIMRFWARQQSNFILGEDNETRSHLDLSQFAQCIMRFWARQQSNFILGENNETRSHLDLSQFAQCIMRFWARQQSNFILGEDNETRSHLDLSQFAQCIMRLINPIWINMPNKEIKVHRRVIQMIIPIIESTNNAGHGRPMQTQYMI